MEFHGKVVVITGGGSGIGRAAALEFAARGASVAVIDREARAGRETVAQMHQKGFKGGFFQADVSKGTEVESAIQKIVSEHGGIDVLINNAGIQRYGTVVSLSEKEWDEVLTINLKSIFLVSKYVIPEIIKRGGGAVVNTASVLSLAAQINAAHYIASKHAVLGLTRAMALDYAPSHIRVNCVCPGAIDTPMLRWSASLDENPDRVLEACNKMHALGRMGRPEEVGRAIMFLASEMASFITGTALLVDGGMLTPIGGMAFQESGTGRSK